MNSHIIHEYFYPEGPDTHEFRLEAPEVHDEYKALMSDWLRGFLGLNQDQATKRFTDYLDSFATPVLAPLTDALRQNVPTSILTHESKAWLLLKAPDETEEPYGLSIPSPHESLPDSLLAAFPLAQHNDAEAIIRHFAGYRMDIPPTAGLHWPEDIQLASEEITHSDPDWAGAIMLYLPGNGDVGLLNPDGRFGFWLHELGYGCPAGAGAIEVAGDISKLLSHLLGKW